MGWAVSLTETAISIKKQINSPRAEAGVKFKLNPVYFQCDLHVLEVTGLNFLVGMVLRHASPRLWTQSTPIIKVENRLELSSPKRIAFLGPRPMPFQ